MKISPAKILVIDDELGMREGIRRILMGEGHQVGVAENGQEGLAKGLKQEYDLYFLDLKMPDLDGTEVLRKIKAKYPEAICVIITAYASIDTAVETTQLGAYNYMAKPFTPDELLHLTNRALERRWYILEARRLREERERRLLEVAREKSRIRTIINAIDDGILVLNQQGELVFFNPRFLQLLDIQTELKIGEQVVQILPAQMAKQIQEILNNHQYFKAIRQEIVIKPPAEMVVMVNTTPVLDESGQLIGVVSVFRDISQLKQLELLKSQFVNMVAHELKAPLGAIQGYLEMIINKTLGDEPEIYEKYLKRSLERSRALLDLINDLLNISRIEAGKVRREIERVCLSELVQEAVEFFRSEAEKRSITITLDLQPDLFVDVDKEELLRVLNNLISNAIKYNKDSGEIHISTSKNKHYVSIRVRDTGIGMKEEEKARLFEEFFRAKNQYTRGITGTGLGLSLVKKIVESYAGKIIVESEFEKGSTFTVFLPESLNSSKNK